MSLIMQQKRIGGGWVLVQDGDRLIVRANWAGPIIGIALLLVMGIALCLLACVGVWRLADSKDAGALLCIGPLGVFFLVIGVTLLVQGETPCIMGRQSGMVQGIGSFRRKVVCRLDEITANIQQDQARRTFRSGHVIPGTAAPRGRSRWVLYS